MKLSGAPSREPVILRPETGPRSNYLAWKRSNSTIFSERFGEIASVMDTGVEHVTALPDAIGIGGIDVGEDMLGMMMAEQFKLFIRDQHELGRKKQPFFLAIEATLSDGAIELVRNDPTYDAAKVAHDTTNLLVIIRNRFYTAVLGNDPSSRIREKLQMERAFANSAQGREKSLGTFVQEQREIEELLRDSYLVPFRPDDERALALVSKLDPKRYEGLQQAVNNGLITVATVEDVHDRASRWVQLAPTHPNTSVHPVYVSTATAPATDATGVGAGAFGGGRSGVGRGGGRGRGRAGAGSGGTHPTGARSPQATRGSSATGQDPLGQLSAEERATMSEDAACTYCGQLNHSKWKDGQPQCPRFIGARNKILARRRVGTVQQALLTSAGIDDDDLLSDDGTGRDQHQGFMTRVVTVQQQDTEVAFAASESAVVIWDTAASCSVFHSNCPLLGTVTLLPMPASIAGIVKGAPDMTIDTTREFCDLGPVMVSEGATANILSQSEQLRRNALVEYKDDRFYVTPSGARHAYIFARRLRADGSASSVYTCSFPPRTQQNQEQELGSESQGPRYESLAVATVKDNMGQFTKREVAGARKARELMGMGIFTSSTMKKMLPTIEGCGVTGRDVDNAEEIFGPSLGGVTGKSVRERQPVGDPAPAPRRARVAQALVVDIAYLKGICFLICKIMPLGFLFAAELASRATSCVATAIRRIIGSANARSFDITTLRSDGEGAVGKMSGELSERYGIVVDTLASGDHASVERDIRTVKERFRGAEATAPMTLCRKLIAGAVICLTLMINLEPTAAYGDGSSAYTRFVGLNPRMDVHFRGPTLSFVHALKAKTVKWNSSDSRTDACVLLYPVGTSGACRAMKIRTGELVTVRQLKIMPYSDVVIDALNAIAAAEGYRREQGPLTDGLDADDRRETPTLPAPTVPFGGLPTASDTPPGELREEEGDTNSTQYLDVDEREEGGPEPDSDGAAQYKDGEGDAAQRQETNGEPPLRPPVHDMLRRCAHAGRDDAAAGEEHWAYKTSYRAALRDRPEEAIPVIVGELQQLLDKKVFDPVHERDLTRDERAGIIRCSLFVKEKFTPDGSFDKMKGRLVAGGDQQDKSLYDNLSAPTVSMSSVFAVAGIAAHEGRHVATVDIAGAYLNASMAPTGVAVYMRIDRTLSKMLTKLDPRFAAYVGHTGTVVVRLNRALYGCVESAGLWFDLLQGVLIEYGFVGNRYDPCVMNRDGASKKQTTTTVFVDDLLLTSEIKADIEQVLTYVEKLYPGATVHWGPVVSYLGMTLDFRVARQVSITMAGATESILRECGVEGTAPTPCSASLFDERDTSPAATPLIAAWAHSYTARLLYIAKRVHHALLLPVSYLATRVHTFSEDDIHKVHRALKYLRSVKDKGIVIRVGDKLQVRAYIDAAYGVHTNSGKSHTGCAITIGHGGAVDARSAKQRIVTKSSTEAELVALSDTASRAIHIRNFLMDQGHEMEPAIIFQDNLSTMALVRRGRPGAEGSRHMNIREFWIRDRVQAGEVIIKHLSTERMFANVLTKPLQGKQFIDEEAALRNWGK